MIPRVPGDPSSLQFPAAGGTGRSNAPTNSAGGLGALHRTRLSRHLGHGGRPHRRCLGGHPVRHHLPQARTDACCGGDVHLRHPQAVPAEQRDYVMRIRSAATAVDKIRLYARAVAAMSPRTAPLFMALQDEAPTDADCAALEKEISLRRAANMRLFAANMRGTGQLRPELSDDYIADVVWATAGAPHCTQLVGGRGWPPEDSGGLRVLRVLRAGSVDTDLSDRSVRNREGRSGDPPLKFRSRSPRGRGRPWSITGKTRGRHHRATRQAE